MLKININAHNITNLSDARYFAAKEVKWVSFNFMEHSPRYIEPMKANAMMEWIEGPMIIGEFDGLEADALRFYTEGWHLDMIQVGPMTHLDTIKGIKNIPIIKAYMIEEFTNPSYLAYDMAQYSPFVEAFSLDFNTYNIDFDSLFSDISMISLADLKDLCAQYKIILNIDFQADKIDMLLDLPLYGICLSGGEEERVGVKSFDELEAIFEKIEVEA
jgi:phosphoribosylanthranilate isomerase